MLEYIFMQMTLDCKWSGRKASAKCVQTAPEAYISRIYLLALKLEANNSWNNPGEQQEDEFLASFPANCLPFVEI